MLFVKCVDDNGETVLLNANRIKLVRRHYRDERNDVIETDDGKMYGCTCSGSSSASIQSCLLDINPISDELYYDR